jgi:hypothetical protein
VLYARLQVQHFLAAHTEDGHLKLAAKMCWVFKLSMWHLLSCPIVNGLAVLKVEWTAGYAGATGEGVGCCAACRPAGVRGLVAKRVDSLLMQMSHDLAVATAAWDRVGTVWQRPLLLLCQASHPCLDLCVCAVVSSVSPLLQLSFPATVLPWIPFRG